MGVMLSVLLSYVGAIELVFVLRDITHQVCLHDKQNAYGKDTANEDNDLKRYQDRIRKSLSDAIESIDIQAHDNLTQMQDGVLYDNGYRIENTEDLESIRQQIENIALAAATKVSDDQNRSPDEFLQNERTANNVADNRVSKPTHSTQLLNAKPSEESSSYEPLSPQSSAEMPDIHFDEYDHPESSMPNDQYSEEYLRSLDGIKFRPLVRDDGTGRRRAYKKRQQSSSSTSSDQPSRRSSREDELKMFTSLEEEEFEAIRKDGNYSPLQYSSEPNLKVHKKHSRRHKRSPVREGTDNANRRHSSDLDDNDRVDPWGDVQPNQFHDTDLWKRERANSIAEEDNDEGGKTEANAAYKSLQLDNEKGQRNCFSPVGKKTPRLSSFEDATDSQHAMAINALKRQNSKENTLNETNVTPGKNVSTDSTTDNEPPLLTPDADTLNADDTNNATYIASLPVVASDATPTQQQSQIVFQIDDVADDLTENAKIQEFISYIEKLDHDKVDQEIDNEKYQFKEFLDQPQRLRHTSYNIDDKDLESFVDVTKFIEAEQNFEIISRQQNDEPVDAKNKYETSLKVNVEDYEQQTKAVEPELVAKSAYTLEDTNEPETPKEIVDEFIVPKKAYVVTSDYESSDISTPAPVTQLSIDKSFDRARDLSPSFRHDTGRISINRQESNFSTISLDSGHTKFSLDKTFDLRHKSRSPSSAYSPGTSTLPSPYSSYQRSPSPFERRQPDSFDDLEYIHGREDWRNANGMHLNHQVESDSYHHLRRYSETAETLEYIKGREDWAQFMNVQALSGIDEHERSRSSLSIRREVDSDEYHHCRRLSEALDLAYRSYVRTNSGGVLFVAQGSVLNGRERSPYHLLRAEIDRDEFMKLYSWKEQAAGKFDTYVALRENVRSMSESRDTAEEQMIRNERLAWTQTKEITHIHSVEHRVETKTVTSQIVESTVECNPNDSSDDEVKVIDTTSGGGDNVIDVQITPGEDVVEFVVWDINSDGKDDEEISDDVVVDESTKDFEIIDENVMNNLNVRDEHSVPTEVATMDKDSSPKPLKKSKRIDDLVEAERRSIDLTDEKDALLAMLSGSKILIDAEKESTVASVPKPNVSALAESTKLLLESEAASSSGLLIDAEKESSVASVTKSNVSAFGESTRLFLDSKATSSSVIGSAKSKSPISDKKSETDVSVTPKSSVSSKPDKRIDSRSVRKPRHSVGVDELLKETSLSPWFHK